MEAPDGGSRENHEAVGRSDGRVTIITPEWRSWPPKEVEQTGAAVIGWRVMRRLWHLLVRWLARIRERRRLRSLATLDDRLLRDIGFARCELLNEASKPFWREGRAALGLPALSGRDASAKPSELIVLRIARRSGDKP